MWVDQRCKDAIDAPYFHVVFTMPQELHRLLYQNQKELYKLMYRTVSETLFKLSLDPNYLGAQPGFFCILHTWGQDLHYHPHIHAVVMAGGLTKLNKWKSSSKKFFIPVKVLSKMFRGKYLHYLKQYYQENLLTFDGELQPLQSPEGFKKLLATRNKKTKLALCRKLTSSATYIPKFEGLNTLQVLTLLLGRDVTKCPKCKSELQKSCFPRGSPAVAN